MKPDSEIKRDVEAELNWSPDVDQTDLAVKVNNGVVTLTGFVPSFFEKYRAEEAAKRIAGVAGLANDVRVRPAYGLDDPEIARAAVAAIRVELPSDAESVKALVQNGHVTLEGNLEWNFQRERVEDVVRRITGVITVDNQIMIKPRVKPSDIKRMIEDAFRRSAEVDASHISVKTEGGTVTLSGRVRTWSERAQAQQTAWFAPGVSQVKNEITIST
jgi:osmotically-inducible protein OsmY